MRKLICVVVALVCLAGRTFGAEGIYLAIDGIPGEVTQKGREGWVRVLAMNHEIVSPRDSASGQATGKRQHMPLRCVIPHDKSFPLIMKALTQNSVIPKMTVNFYRTVGTTGVEELYMKYELTNVAVSSARPWLPNVKDASTADFGTQVEVAFVYQKIVWTFTNGGITHEDSWEQVVR